MKIAAPLFLLASLTRSAFGQITLDALTAADDTATVFSGINTETNTIRVGYTDMDAVMSAEADLTGMLYIKTPVFKTGTASACNVDITQATYDAGTSKIPPFATTPAIAYDETTVGAHFATITVDNHATDLWVVGAPIELCMELQIYLKGVNTDGTARDATKDDLVYTRNYIYTITVTAEGGTSYSAQSASADIEEASGTADVTTGVGAASNEKPGIYTTLANTPPFGFGEGINLNVKYNSSAANVFKTYVIDPTTVKPYSAVTVNPTTGALDASTPFIDNGSPILFTTPGTIADATAGDGAQTQTATITGTMVPLKIYQRNPANVIIAFEVSYLKYSARRLSSEGTIRGLQESGTEASATTAELSPLTKEQLENLSEEELIEAGIDPADYGLDFSAGVAAQAGVAAFAALVAGVALVF